MEILLKIFNIGLAVFIFILGILWFLTDVFEPTAQFVILLLSVVFLSFGIEKIKDGMKRVGYLYLFVFLILVITVISTF